MKQALNSGIKTRKKKVNSNKRFATPWYYTITLFVFFLFYIVSDDKTLFYAIDSGGGGRGMGYILFLGALFYFNI